MTVQELKSAYQQKLPYSYEDPVMARVSLPHKAMFFPLGFPVDIRTNAPEVLDVAAHSWQGHARMFKRRPIQLRVVVLAENDTACPPAPSIRVHGHVLANIADKDNYSVVDLTRQRASIAITPAVLRDLGYFRYFFLESAAMSVIAAKHATGVHAACVELDGHGVLLCGDSGAGKSTLSYACARAGWTYITDDASYLVRERRDRLVVGNYTLVRFRPSAVALFPMLQGAEVIRRAEVGKPSIELLTEDHAQLKRAPSSYVRHVVFLKRKSVKDAKLVRFPLEVARQYMLQTASCLPGSRAERTAQIDTFLCTQPLELQYEDLPRAVERLSKLVREGHS